jgi:AcrR family transcriptional regulator
MRSVTDRTARQLIRDEALRLFAELGPEAVSLRDIAEAAGVSAALLIHHFGSKAGLRRAVDEYVVTSIEQVLDGDGPSDGTDPDRDVVAPTVEGLLAPTIATALPPDPAVVGYVRRLLLSGDPAGMRLFAQWFEIVRGRVARLTASGDLRPGGDPAVLAAFLLVNDVGLLLLREHLAAVLRTDPLSRTGVVRWHESVGAVYRNGLLPTEH